MLETHSHHGFECVQYRCDHCGCWEDTDTKKFLFNIVPTGSSEPTGGFFQKTQIENLKGVKFPDNVLEFVKNGRESYDIN